LKQAATAAIHKALSAQNEIDNDVGPMEIQEAGAEKSMCSDALLISGFPIWSYSSVYGEIEFRHGSFLENKKELHLLCFKYRFNRFVRHICEESIETYRHSRYRGIRLLFYLFVLLAIRIKCIL
jgi:hypothetical protein